VRPKSLDALKDRVRARTICSRSDSLQRIIADINPTLRGWFEYFQRAQPAMAVFLRIDQMIRRRLRAILRKQDHRPGMGRAKADHLRWTNAFFASQGLFTLATALAEARHSR
jgi:RNA-directed DNA polymerase